VKFLVASTLSGTIKYVGMLWSGKTADITLFRAELGWLSFKGKRLHADLGFLGLGLNEGALVMPHKKPRNKTLTEEQKRENKTISSLRVIVENVIAGVKHFFICSIRSRFRKLKNIQENFELCSGLGNIKGFKRK